MRTTKFTRDHGKFTLDHGAILLGGVLLLVVGVALQPTAAAVQANNGTNPAVVQRVVPSLPAIATSDSNASMIAVTGIDLSGSSILYLVDTNARQIAIYQASGGSDSMQGIKLVGARKIDLDLQLEGFNDKSQFTYEALEKKFQENQRAPNAAPKKP